MRNISLLVIGDINEDIVIKVKRFPGEDDEVEASSLGTFPGGDAANIATQTTRLGLRTLLIGSIDQEECGRKIKQNLQRVGVDVAGLQMTSHQHSGMVVSVVREDGQRSLITYRGANTDLRLTEAYREFFESAHFVHISDPLPQVIEALPALLEPEHTLLSLDPGAISAAKGLAYLDPILKICDFLFCNQLELKLLSGKEDVGQAVRILMDRGVKNVIIKQGKDGCLIYTQEGKMAVEGFSVPVVDTTGAGDAFDGGMIYALLNNMPLEQAARFASAVGALSVQQMGGQSSQPSLNEVEQFLLGD